MQKSFNFFVVLTLASFILTKGNLIYKEDNDLDAKISTKQENARKVRSAPHAGFCEPEDPEILFQSQVVCTYNNVQYINLGGPYYLPKNYSRIVAPDADSNHLPHEEPILVTLKTNHLDVLEVNDLKYTIKLQMYLGLQWNDPRIIRITEEELTTADRTALDLNQLEILWVPDLDIYNLSKIEHFKVIRNMQGLWISDESKLSYFQTTIVTILCSMNFNRFPLDVQRCKFSVGSYAYDMDHMRFDTFKPKDKDPHIEGKVLLDYDIKIHDLRPEDKLYFWEGTGSNYSLAGFELEFRRHKLQYIIQYYVPSGLFVVVSWVSFLVDPDVVPGRMTLLVTLFLVLTNIFNKIPESSPKVTAFSALSAWVLTCILFVFGALCGYAGILFRKMIFSKIYPGVIRRPPTTTDIETNPIRDIDTKFLILFPSLFLLFNIVYWSSLS